MKQLTLPAPGKLNLFLHICGRREDGYHQLQTVFQFLDYADQIQFTLTPGQDGQIKLKTPLVGVAEQDNLIVRAAHALRKSTGCNAGATIVLDKKLPLGGGIGGGSSDAATTLIALNRLWQTGLNQQELQDIGLNLGADVPIFIHGSAAWAEGVGEILQEITLPEPWYLVLVPPCHISTTEIFSHRQLTRDTQAIKMSAFFEQGGHNDCEPLVRSLYPQVAEALDWLDQYGSARMTGTGACVFAQFASRQEAEIAFGKCPKQLQGFIARGVNRSPLHEALERY